MAVCGVVIIVPVAAIVPVLFAGWRIPAPWRDHLLCTVRTQRGNYIVELAHLAVSKDAPSFAFLRKKQHLLDKSSLAPSVTNISVPHASPCLPQNGR